jgi:NAD(P)-dependent dehydrogenase (short-subunit alcohol dehydrogenase family)
MDKKVWYLTGVSKGLGLALINRLLREGHRVAAVPGPGSGLDCGSGAISGLASGAIPAWPDHGLAEAMPMHPSLLPLEADLADEQSVADSIRQTCEAFGRIDVVVNNAGYGLGAPIAHTITVIQKAMSRLRAQRSGHLINVAPITGVTIGTPHGHAFYAAARQATIDLSATLADDVRPLGIRVTAVLSDGFHTRLPSRRALPGVAGMPGTPGTLRTSGTVGTLGAAQLWHISVDGRLPGDPGKAAEALLRIATAAEPPALAYLTSHAYRTATEKMTLFRQVIASRQCATSF